MGTFTNGTPWSGTADPWVVADYEADMFFTLTHLLEKGNQVYAHLPFHIQNAVVESSLLHARMLVDIFLSRKSEADDICLSDLLPGFQSNSLELLRQAYGNRKTAGTPCWTLNKMLVHSTQQRCGRYEYTALLNRIHPLLAAIWAEVEKQRGILQKP